MAQLFDEVMRLFHLVDVVVKAGLLHAGEDERLFHGYLARIEPTGRGYEFVAVLLWRAAEFYSPLFGRLYPFYVPFRRRSSKAE